MKIMEMMKMFKDYNKDIIEWVEKKKKNENQESESKKLLFSILEIPLSNRF